MNFRADKYNPETDKSYPKPGDKIDDNRIVRKAEHIEANKLVKLLQSKDLPEDAEHLLILDHPDRTLLKYLVWWEEKK